MLHYHVPKSPSLVPNLGQMNPVHTPEIHEYFSKIHFNAVYV
jgi:hypothetical protein